MSCQREPNRPRTFHVDLTEPDGTGVGLLAPKYYDAWPGDRVRVLCGLQRPAVLYVNAEGDGWEWR